MITITTTVFTAWLLTFSYGTGTDFLVPGIANEAECHALAKRWADATLGDPQILHHTCISYGAGTRSNAYEN